MTAVGSLGTLLVVTLGVFLSSVLHVLVRAEGESEMMDREKAERAARRDADALRR